jgi:type IV pilus assembly protein PilM
MFGSGAAWGIDLGHSAIKAVRMGRSGGTFQVTGYEIIDLAKVLSDPKASREERLRAGVQALINKHGLRSEKVVISIPAKGVLSKFIDLPPVDRKKIPEMIQFEARQQIPFDLKDVIWRYQPVRKEFPPGESVQVGLFAVRRDQVEVSLKFFDPIKKRLAGVQIAPLATYNFIRHDQKVKGAMGIIDVGAENTDLIIVSEKGFWLRSLHVAGNGINRVLMEKFNISFEEAETIKHRIAESKYRKQIMEVIQPIFRELAMELDRSLGYYKSLSKDVRIERLIFMGGGIKVAGIERFLAENLHYPIQKLNEIHGITLGPNVNNAAFLEALPGLGVALGLAIQGLNAGDITVNLLPDEFIFEREVDQKKPWAIAAMVFLAATLGLWYKGEMDINARVEPVLEGLESPDKSVLVKAEKLDKQYDAAEKAISYDTLNFLRNIPNQQGGPRDLWLRLTEQISDIIPDGVYLRELHSEIGDPDEIERKLRGAGEGAAREEVREGAPAPAGAGPAAPTPAGAEGKPVDLSKQRLSILIQVETEYGRQHGLEFIRLKVLATLEDISLREDGKPAFKTVEMLGSREEVRNGLGETIKPGQSERAEVVRGGSFEAQRLQRLRAQRFRYLVVPVWCVVNSEEDYKALPEADTVDKTVAEVKAGEHDALPTSNLLAQEGTGPAVMQIKNNSDAPLTVYLSGKKQRVVRVRPTSTWHVLLEPGRYQVAVKSEKEGSKPAYGEQDFPAGAAYGFDF